MLQTQVARRVEKIQVAAVGHAADEVADAGSVDGVHGVKELLLQPAAAGIVLVAAPGQLVFPVAGEAAGVFALGHGGSLLSGVASIVRARSAAVKPFLKKVLAIFSRCVIMQTVKQLNRDVFGAGCNSRPAVIVREPSKVESVQFRYRQYSLDDRRCYGPP